MACGEMCFLQAGSCSAILFEEMRSEFGNIGRMIAQRGHAKRDDIQAVVQILAKAPIRDRFEQVHVGGRDDAHVDGNGFRTADALDLAFLQNAQQLGLQRQRHLADFIQKDGAAMRLFEQSNACIDGSREGALGVAEEFGFEQMIGKSGAVDRNHPGRRPVARHVQRARGYFLAGAGFAGDQNGGAAVADQFDDFDYFTHRRAGADQQIAPASRLEWRGLGIALDFPPW